MDIFSVTSRHEIPFEISPGKPHRAIARSSSSINLSSSRPGRFVHLHLLSSSPFPWSQISSQTHPRNAGRAQLVYHAPSAGGRSPLCPNIILSHRLSLSSSLKLRCDRNIPCGSCVKRGCGAICPDGTSSSPSFLSFLHVIAPAV